MSETRKDTFQLGLALAGAISAGAYTAGVLDFLFQALSEWEEARKRAEPDVPGHRVGLRVIAGASAGAITGALGAVALARGLRPTPLTQAEIDGSYRKAGIAYQALRCMLPSLYDTWVTRPRMVDPDGGTDFLSTEDLHEQDVPQREAVRSLLNAKLLDEIKRLALLPDSGAQPPTAVPPYGYIAETLHIYMTVSNLRGIPFTVGFGNSKYGMQTHADRVHYAIAGLGSWNWPESGWVKADKSLSLEVTSLPMPGAAVPPDWDDYGTCALASSAFPIGLSPRRIATPMTQYEARSYPLELPPEVVINPHFPDAWMASGERSEFTFLNVDGGLINNNPFDYTQFALMGTPAAGKTSGAAADSAVVMIAPFPEPPAFLPDGQPLPALVDVIRALFPTLINQARFKASELAPALSSDDHSRFLIAPHRKLPDSDTEQRYTIACGLLGGFGGFLDETFRAHDFQLGRRNCQAFLLGTFGLPADNPVVAGIVGREQYRLPGELAAGESPEYRIIPLIGSAAPEVALPRWPRMSQPDFDLLLARVKGRLQAVAPALVRAQTASRLLRSIGRIGLWVGRGRLLEYTRLAILSDLVRRDQIAGWELPPPVLRWLRENWGNESGKAKTADDIRAVLAELASPAFDLRTVAGISAKTHLDPAFVTGALAQLCQVSPNLPISVWCADKNSADTLFTLTSRKPRGLRAWPFVKELANLLEAPATDRSSAGKALGA